MDPGAEHNLASDPLQSGLPSKPSSIPKTSTRTIDRLQGSAYLLEFETSFPSSGDMEKYQSHHHYPAGYPGDISSSYFQGDFYYPRNSPAGELPPCFQEELPCTSTHILASSAVPPPVLVKREPIDVYNYPGPGGVRVTGVSPTGFAGKTETINSSSENIYGGLM